MTQATNNRVRPVTAEPGSRPRLSREDLRDLLRLRAKMNALVRLYNMQDPVNVTEEDWERYRSLNSEVESMLQRLSQHIDGLPSL